VLAAVEDGDQALKACRDLRPDVLTLDLAMPGLDGIGVLRGLREESSPIPVVVVSAFLAGTRRARRRRPRRGRGRPRREARRR